MQPPTTLPDPIAAINAWATVASAAAAIVVAGFAALQLWREYRREDENRRLKDAQVSAHAYLIRDRIARWIGYGLASEDAGTGDHLYAWMQQSSVDRIFQQQVFEVQARVTELLTLAAGSSASVGEGVRSAAVSVLQGTKHLLRYASMPQRETDFERSAERNAAKALLHRAVATLDSKVIDQRLQEERDRVTQIAAAVHPLKLIERAMSRDDESTNEKDGSDTLNSK